MLCWPSAPIIISAWRTVPSRNCTDGFPLDVPRAGGEARCTSALNITSAPARVAASCKILWRSLYCSRMDQYVMPKSQPDDLDTRASCKTWHHFLGLQALPTQGIRSACRSQLSRELVSRQEVRKARHSDGEQTYNPRDSSLHVREMPFSLFPPRDPIPRVFLSRLVEGVYPRRVPPTSSFSREREPYDQTRQDQWQSTVQRRLEGLRIYTPGAGPKKLTTTNDNDIQLERCQPPSRL